MILTDDERNTMTYGPSETMQRQHERQLTAYLEERERVEQEERNRLNGYSPLGVKVPERIVWNNVVKKMHQVHAAKENWGEGPPPSEVAIQCRKCKDAGYRTRNGRAELCPDCGASRRRQLRRDRIMAAWPASEHEHLIALARKPFDTTYIDAFGVPLVKRRAIRDQLDHALKTCREFTEEWPSGVMLSLDGTYGAGKSHLLAKIYALALKSSLSAIYIIGPDFERMMTNFPEGDAEQKEEARRIRHELIRDIERLTCECY